MAWLICGSVTQENFTLDEGPWNLDDGMLFPVGRSGDPLPVRRGTPALVASAILTCSALGEGTVEALLCGDTGNGKGSRELYARLTAELPDRKDTQGLTFHYLMPDVDGHNRVFMACQECGHRPVLVADAGFMYAAKMSGYAADYDLFTPDAGELAFLADEKAPHPFYARGFLLDSHDNVPGLLARASEHQNAARFMIIKGARDAISEGSRIIHWVDEPQTPAMEAIGGTGDMVTGIVTGLLAGGMDLPQAALTAARAARYAGSLAAPTPATQIAEILPFVPQALRKALAQNGSGENGQK